MMINETYLDEVRVRWEAVRDTVRDVAIEVTSDGQAKILARRGASRVELRVTRDGEPASEGDVLFVGRAFSDIPRLLEALKSGNLLPDEEAAGIDMRIAAASPGPWKAFIESDGGLGGCDVISVSESDSEADMYLWMGADLAPSAVFRFVAEARQDLPALLAATRQSRWPEADIRRN